ncbi:molecular chaperone [Mycolicibacterium chubuense NBB4]|uniref:Molecular chaperone n=1 Tax=Mycolicibacterium chubuense (strain NBB4) TaxID=710421 RepID=I4BL80_MYCCN|nr:Hsp70 family protein [Mycolicibacterium chubuense]AFM18037.1 molecular chaperone [Mycolicibacterium chubuense NBB4]
MGDGAGPAPDSRSGDYPLNGIGLSVGATRLAGVLVDRAAVTRTPVLTLYPHRPPEVGVPAENFDLTEPGLIITDFVDRVGDPVSLIAPDGTAHRAEVLLAEALHALARALPARGPSAISVPAHWNSRATDALAAASTMSAPLFCDARAALIALAQGAGLPSGGVVAVCDFGGTGTTVSVFDVSAGASSATPIGSPLRHGELSGDLVDQALLTRVIDGLSDAGDLDLAGTSAIGPLGRLRMSCRAAKERLSTAAVTALTADLTGRRTDIRLTRDELDEVLLGPLGRFADVMQETLQRNGIGPDDLTAVASVGGGARIPAVTTTLSERFRVPVITPEHPELAAAIGAGLWAVRPAAAEEPTSIAAAAPSALAWSDADDVPDVVAVHPDDYDDYDGDGAPTAIGDAGEPRPSLHFTREPDGAGDPAPMVPWYRRPIALVVLGALVAIGAAVALLLFRDDKAPGPADTRTPVTTTPPPPAAVSTAPGEPSPAPAPPVTTAQAPQPVPPPANPPPAENPPPAPPPAVEPPPPSPPPAVQTPPPSPPPAVQTPPPSPPPTQAPPTQPSPIQGPAITIPGLPPIPIFPQPPPP